MDNPKLTRRDFTLKSALAVLAGTTITISGCESDSPTAPTPDPEPGPVTGVVGSNHGHAAEITRAELTAGNAISLDIQGSSGHPHTVVLTMSDVQQIAMGTRVSKESTVDAGHSHSVTFN